MSSANCAVICALQTISRKSNTCILNKNTGWSDHKLTTALITVVSIIFLFLKLMDNHFCLNKGMYDAI